MNIDSRTAPGSPSFSKYGYRLTFDIESTGSNILKYDMPCFGSCIINAETFEIVDTFKVFIKPQKGVLTWEQACLDEFWNKPENIDVKNKMVESVEKEGLSVKNAMKKFYDWVNIKQNPNVLKDTVVCTDTSAYDGQWMSVYLASAGYDKDVSYLIGGKYKPVRDMTSFLMGVARKTPDQGLWGAEKAACKSLGIDYEVYKNLNPYKHDHDPINDALNIAWSTVFFENELRKLK